MGKKNQAFVYVYFLNRFLCNRNDVCFNFFFKNNTCYVESEFNETSRLMVQLGQMLGLDNVWACRIDHYHFLGLLA